MHNTFLQGMLIIFFFKLVEEKERCAPIARRSSNFRIKPKVINFLEKFRWSNSLPKMFS